MAAAQALPANVRNVRIRVPRHHCAGKSRLICPCSIPSRPVHRLAEKRNDLEQCRPDSQLVLFSLPEVDERALRPSGVA
jgi:hypothetical protein